MASETLYDRPLYYDILFGFDRDVEARFYERCFERCGVGRRERVLEVAAGTGQVALRLARRGWRTTALDVRPTMLAFLRERARAEGVEVGTLCADMASFASDGRFAAAYNPMSSFRLLHRDEAVDAHLRAMAAALRPGGVYVLDLDFLAHEDDEAITTDEAWSMSRDGVTVEATDAEVRVEDHGATRVLAWGEEAHLRGYTVATFADRIGAATGLRVESWHPESSRATGVSEFADEPARETPRQGRAMVVLRRE